ncbi:hypothetical protein Q2T41_18030 [Maribacter confluentis]|uniref:DUF2846 domain-containing protein n=2 Tax=Maribacter confluentis TaxID=1656093 RepID=A0ABT8RVK6_9FLAO|nr:hypothetical protein [Maribacter confluentis]MDO1514557.1 hypothetical protein [Maribacter confluentis]
MKKLKFKSEIIKFCGLMLIALGVSCKTYTIPVDSFREQMKNTNSENKKDVEINNPLTFGKIKYSANDIDRLVVFDKTGQEMYLSNSPSIEMRVTHKNGKKYILYFDTVILENNILKGGRSRFAQGLKREIPMDSIVKIEVQDGGKKFNYQN